MSDAPNPKTRSRLGRGLSSLLSISDAPVTAEVPAAAAAAHAAPAPERSLTAAPAPEKPSTPPASHVPIEVPIEQIEPNPHQPRRAFNESSLAELAASLKSTGLIQPIVVKQTGLTYQLIAGERRLRAAKLAGMKTVPVVIREVDHFKQAQMALVENIQREDLNPLDRAQAYRTLIDQLGLTQAELASRLGEERSSIANFLRLLELTGPVKEMVKSGQLSLGHAKLLAGVSDPVEQERLAKLVLAQELSVRNLERLIGEAGNAKSKTPASTPSAHLQNVERSLSGQLGLRVQLRSSKGGRGRVVIHYSSLDQFDSLVERLGVKLDD